VMAVVAAGKLGWTVGKGINAYTDCITFQTSNCTCNNTHCAAGEVCLYCDGVSARCSSPSAASCNPDDLDGGADAGSDSGGDAGDDGGTCMSAIPGGSCNNLAVPITITKSCGGTPATLAGGSFVDGLYVATQASESPPTGGMCSPTTFGQAFEICGKTWTLIKVDGALTERSTLSATISGSTLTLKTVCGGSGASSTKFEATPTTITLLSGQAGQGQQVVKFVKQ